MEKIRNCKEECTFKGPYPCDEDVFDLCCVLMEENNMQSPDSVATATILYCTLREQIIQNLWPVKITVKWFVGLILIPVDIILYVWHGS